MANRTHSHSSLSLIKLFQLIGKPWFYLFTFFVVFSLVSFNLIKKILRLLKPPKIHFKLPSLHLPTLHLPHVKTKPSIIISFILFVFISFSVYSFFNSLPDPKSLGTQPPALSTKIYDRHGQLLYKIYQDQNRTLISLDKLPNYVIQATLIAEDKNFYHHFGISFTGIIRALKNNLTKQTLQGGSTITQQLVKNALLSPEKTLSRKLKELVLALETEHLYTKNQILEMYLNQIPYGGTAYGIEEAAQFYFAKSAYQLSLAEAAFLAGLPTAPTILSPFSNQPYLAKQRQEQILHSMYQAGYINATQLHQALEQPLAFASNHSPIKAPHFVMYVKSILLKTYSEHDLATKGLNVYTTLDLHTNQILEQNIRQELEKLQNLHVTNGAGLVTNPATGEILAMVGSKNFFDFEHDGQLNVTLQPRQPGSTIKPITYALAFSRGLTPSTKILDAPITFKIPGQPNYTPRNYDGRFHGYVTLRTALACSYNIPAVKLLNTLGIDNFVSLAKEMGITTWNDPSRYGLSLTLGSLETTMLDLATVYGVFANNGVKVPLNPILKITDANGRVLVDNTCQTPPCSHQQVLSPLVAFQINDILSDNNARAPAFGYHSVLNLGKLKVAVKTGTSNNLRDNWTIGYTPNLLVATWVGNNDNSPMSYVASGVTGASPIWAKTISTLLTTTYKPLAFTIPTNIKKVYICPTTNTLYCPECPTKGKWEYFIPGTEPKASCNADLVGKILEKAAATSK